ncbi:MAG: hypothetical protein OXM62_01730, partial [bacterium]|nr:hypothetical protein [bacterium]
MNRFRMAAALMVSGVVLWAGVFPVAGADGWGMGGPVPVLAQTEPPNPWENDPLRLVPFATTSHRVYSLSEDLWEVWVCRVPGWDTQVDVGEAVDFLNSTVGPYFRELSDGRYQPVFRQGGRVESSDEVAS